jgi:cell division protein FtsI/penicillin-binding protein 2
VNESLLVSHPERDRRPLRFIAFGLIGVLVFGLLTTRLAYLQLSNGPEYAAQAEANRTAEVAVPAPRGLIYDRAGKLLVANVATFTVKIRPADLPFSRREDVTRRLGGLLGMDPSDIISTLDSAPGSRFDQARMGRSWPTSSAIPGRSTAAHSRN